MFLTFILGFSRNENYKGIVLSELFEPLPVEYNTALDHMLKNDIRVKKLIETIGKKQLKNKNYSLIYLPHFKVDNLCFVSQDCLYDNNFYRCLRWDKSVFSYLINVENELFYIQSDSTFKHSTFLKLVDLDFFRVSSSEELISLIKTKKMLYFESRLTFIDECGNIKILKDDMYEDISEVFNFYNIQKGDTIKVRGGYNEKSMNDSFYILDYTKKVHSTIPDSLRGCCKCLKIQ